MANPTQQVKENFHQGKDVAQNLKADVKDAGAKIMKDAQEAAPEISDRVWGAVATVKGQLADYTETGKKYVGQGESLIKKYPFLSIAIAGAVGTLIGGMVFRRSMTKHV